MLCYAMLYYTTYYTILYHTIPYHTIPYHTIPYHTIHSFIYLFIYGYVSTKKQPDGDKRIKSKGSGQTVRKPLCSVVVGSIVQYWTSSDLCYRSLIINAGFARTLKVLKF